MEIIVEGLSIINNNSNKLQPFLREKQYKTLPNNFGVEVEIKTT